MFGSEHPSAAALSTSTACRVRITGLVQGVGFRPFVHRIAIRHGLSGWVRNGSGNVEIHVEGESAVIEQFVAAIRNEAPVLSRFDSFSMDWLTPSGLETFEVRASAFTQDGRLPVSPDVALCAACAAELEDPANRRYRYPFITCTDCGPRFTIIESMPYDRERTTMRAFTQCEECRLEYESPGDRRYHSETNSCAACGPTLWFEPVQGEGPFATGEDALAAAAALLRDGGILAMRGLGGFHLAVDATNASAVARLRDRKHREARPLAVMVASLDDARRHAVLTPAEQLLLTSAASPIVTVARRPTRQAGAIVDGVAPGLGHVGIMLPYTPLHRLLARDAGVPLVMTSGNLSEEPIATGVDEARERLSGIADGFLLHDREIVARYDDSVVRVVDDSTVFLRRARGFAPTPIDLPVSTPRPLFAVGPHLKNTFTLMEGRRAYVSQHIGDLENVETLDHFGAALVRFETLFRIRPEVVVHDRHPGYLSTRLAAESGLESLGVQHHHAHIAAVMAEHGVSDPVIGVAYDGTGYGDDHNVWGSEILLADLAGYRRVGHLRYAPLPGGDAAVRAPWRCALGYLSLDAAGSDWAPGFVEPAERALIVRQLSRRINAPLASSMGRLFDAAASVLGVRHRSNYEGQAAMELETLAGMHTGWVLPFGLVRTADGWEFDPLPLLKDLASRTQSGESAERLAAAFHDTVVAATVALVSRASESSGLRTVALGGGCFQNARLLSSLRRTLEHDGFHVLVPERLGPNDGSVSVGQAAVAAAVLSGMTSAVVPHASNVSIGG